MKKIKKLNFLDLSYQVIWKILHEFYIFEIDVKFPIVFLCNEDLLTIYDYYGRFKRDFTQKIFILFKNIKFHPSTINSRIFDLSQIMPTKHIVFIGCAFYIFIKYSDFPNIKKICGFSRYWPEEPKILERLESLEGLGTAYTSEHIDYWIVSKLKECKNLKSLIIRGSTIKRVNIILSSISLKRVTLIGSLQGYRFYNLINMKYLKLEYEINQDILFLFVNDFDLLDGFKNLKCPTKEQVNDLCKLKFLKRVRMHNVVLKNDYIEKLRKFGIRLKFNKKCIFYCNKDIPQVDVDY